MGSSGHLVTSSLQDVPGLSQDIPHGILWTSSQVQLAGCPRTVLGRPSWDPPDIQSTPACRMSQDCPRTSHMGSSGQLVNPSLQDVPGLSQDVHHGILQTSSQPQFAGCPRTVLGCPTWDPPDIQSPSLQGCPRTVPGSGHPVNTSLQDVPGMSQDVPHGILWTSSHPRTLVGLSKDVRTLVGNTGHECISTYASHAVMDYVL